MVRSRKAKKDLNNSKIDLLGGEDIEEEEIYDDSEEEKEEN